MAIHGHFSAPFAKLMDLGPGGTTTSIRASFLSAPELNSLVQPLGAGRPPASQQHPREAAQARLDQHVEQGKGKGRGEEVLGRNMAGR